MSASSYNQYLSSIRNRLNEGADDRLQAHNPTFLTMPDGWQEFYAKQDKDPTYKLNGEESLKASQTIITSVLDDRPRNPEKTNLQVIAKDPEWQAAIQSWGMHIDEKHWELVVDDPAKKPHAVVDAQISQYIKNRDALATALDGDFQKAKEKLHESNAPAQPDNAKPAAPAKTEPHAGLNPEHLDAISNVLKTSGMSGASPVVHNTYAFTPDTNLPVDKTVQQQAQSRLT